MHDLKYCEISSSHQCEFSSICDICIVNGGGGGGGRPLTFFGRGPVLLVPHWLKWKIRNNAVVGSCAFFGPQQVFGLMRFL